MNAEAVFSPLRWGGSSLSLLDQTRLPGDEIWVECRDDGEVARAIRDLVVRGAPAIGCAAAYGVALAARLLAARAPNSAAAELRAGVEDAIERLRQTRPTAVNLFWALAQMREATAAALAAGGDANDVATALERRACAIHDDDIAMCRRIGDHGARLLPDDATVLTHCNAGALATGGYGTALGVLRSARTAGKRVRVLADETRPFFQGARLTAWELARDGFDVTVIPDSAAAYFLRRGEVSCCIVGADRIAANGDVVNKVGTYGVALAARANGVPFYVAAPATTVDLATATGDDVPIEERAGSELLVVGGVAIAPLGAGARYPAFDVTPAALVSAIITDGGVAEPPYETSLPRVLGRR